MRQIGDRWLSMGISIVTLTFWCFWMEKIAGGFGLGKWITFGSPMFELAVVCTLGIYWPLCLCWLAVFVLLRDRRLPFLFMTGLEALNLRFIARFFSVMKMGFWR